MLIWKSFWISVSWGSQVKDDNHVYISKWDAWSPKQHLGRRWSRITLMTLSWPPRCSELLIWWRVSLGALSMCWEACSFCHTHTCQRDVRCFPPPQIKWEGCQGSCSERLTSVLCSVRDTVDWSQSDPLLGALEVISFGWTSEWGGLAGSGLHGLSCWHKNACFLWIRGGVYPRQSWCGVIVTPAQGTTWRGCCFPGATQRGGTEDLGRKRLSALPESQHLWWVEGCKWPRQGNCRWESPEWGMSPEPRKVPWRERYSKLAEYRRQIVAMPAQSDLLSLLISLPSTLLLPWESQKLVGNNPCGGIQPRLLFSWKAFCRPTRRQKRCHCNRSLKFCLWHRTRHFICRSELFCDLMWPKDFSLSQNDQKSEGPCSHPVQWWAKN